MKPTKDDKPEYTAILSEYNLEWPEWYLDEKLNLERLIGTSALRESVILVIILS